MNRREALFSMGTAALAAGGLGGMSHAQVIKKSSRVPGGPIRVALIGAKGQGGRALMPSIVGSRQCQLAAVCDVDSKVLAHTVQAASELYAQQGVTDSIRSTGDFREVMADDAIDAVAIATPDHWHVPLAKAAVLAGKDVYVEKPLSLSVVEGRELADLVASHDAIVQVGSQHRSADRFFLAAAVVQSGMLGKVKHTDIAIRTREGINKPFQAQPVPPELDYEMYVGPVPWTDYHPERVHYDFRFVSDFSGGEIANWGAHYLDSAQQALGLDGQSPVRVQGTGTRHPPGSIHSSFFDIEVNYEYADGRTLSLTSVPDKILMGITFRGEHATLFVNRDEFKMDKPELMKLLPKEQARAMPKTKGSHMENWLACVRSRRKEDLHAPVEIGHRSAVLCHMANLAIEVGRPLQWDEERESFVNDAFANALLNRPVREPWRGR